MNWIKYSINTTTFAEDFVSAMLMELGIVSIEIENNVPVSGEKQGGEYEELQPDLPEDEGRSKVSFYLGEEEDHESLLMQVLPSPLPAVTSRRFSESAGAAEKGHRVRWARGALSTAAAVS